MANVLTKKTLLTASKVASVALAAYRFVILSTDTDAVEYPGAQYADGVFGITLHAASAGKQVEIGVFGDFPLQVNGGTAITAGDPMGVYDGTTGYGMDVTGAASRPYFATALTATSTTGDIITVRMPPSRALTTA